jgi:V/A-type H+-transporting ATPase subunit D
MSRLNVAPTKSNQLGLRRDLAVAAEGFSLLDQKREILVMELMRLLDRIREVHADVEERRRRAYNTLRKTIARNGYHRLRNLAAGVHYQHQVSGDTRIAAGVRVPRITIATGEFSSQFGFAGSDSLVDQTMGDFLALLAAIARQAELESAAWLLARELKKTQRRVNALEQIFIPDFKDTLRYIGDVLAGKDLDAFFVLKLVKRNNEAKARADAGEA